MINRYYFIILLLGFTLVLTQCSKPNQKQAGPGSAPSAQDADALQKPPPDIHKRYNILMIVSDALRQDALGCYGGEAKTPNIDWLASQGAIFNNAYSTSPWTVPSSVSMLTGNYPTTYTSSPFKKSVQINVPNSELLVAEVLKKMHYQVVAAVENPHARIHNNFQGFDNTILDESLKFDTFVPNQRKKRISAIIKKPLLKSLVYHNVYVWVDRIMNGDDHNFFYFDWMLDPHMPYDPSPDFGNKIVVDKHKLPQNEKIYHRPLSPHEKFSDYEKRYNKKLYLAEVESVDERVGMLLRALKFKKLLSTTYVIFTADHGEQFGEHGQTGHGGFGKHTNYYNTLVKVPLIITGPSIPPGQKIGNTVSTIGIMPTIKELLGLNYEESMQGVSFLPLLLGRGIERNVPLYFVNVVKNEQRDGLLYKNYKLIASSTTNQFELYDLLRDPSELHNIADKFPDIVKAMNQRLIVFRKNNELKLLKNAKRKRNSNFMSSAEQKRTVKKLKELGYMK